MLWTAPLRHLPAFVLFSLLAHAAQLKKGPNPNLGELKIQLDYEEYQHTNAVLLSSHLVFKQTIPISGETEGIYLEMAARAQEEADAQLAYYEQELPSPATMTVLVFGNEIIMATSVKGKWGARGALFDPPVTPVSHLLQQCIAASVNPSQPNNPQSNTQGTSSRHRANAGCAEMMALELFYIKYPGRSLKGAWIVTYNRDIGWLAACGGGRREQMTIGCRHVLAQAGVNEMQSEGRKSYQLSTLVDNSGPVSSSQISLWQRKTPVTSGITTAMQPLPTRI